MDIWSCLASVLVKEIQSSQKNDSGTTKSAYASFLVKRFAFSFFRLSETKNNTVIQLHSIDVELKGFPYYRRKFDCLSSSYGNFLYS